MTFAEMMGLPHEDSIPIEELEDYRETIAEALTNACIVGIDISLGDWAGLTHFERAVVLAYHDSVSEEAAKLEAMIDKAMEGFPQ